MTLGWVTLLTPAHVSSSQLSLNLQALIMSPIHP